MKSLSDPAWTEQDFRVTPAELDTIVMALDVLAKKTGDDLKAIQNEVDDIARSEFVTDYDLSWDEQARHEMITLGCRLARIRLMLNAIDEALVASKENQNV